MYLCANYQWQWSRDIMFNDISYKRAHIYGILTYLELFLFSVENL